MSEKKSITIASDSLLGGSSSKRKSSKRGMGSGERKIRPSSIVQPSTLKKTLLERIKQHQRTRERSRRDDSNAVTGDDSVTASASASDSATAPSASNDNFTQSIDFLRKLAMKRRQQQQHTQRRVNSSSSSISRFPEAKTNIVPPSGLALTIFSPSSPKKAGIDWVRPETTATYCLPSIT